jgi:hypothetical protein
MGTGPAETIRSHPCHVNGGDDVVIPHAPKADPRTNRLRAALEPEDFALLEPQLEVIDLRRGQVLYGMGGYRSRHYFPHEAIVSIVKGWRHR